MAHLELFVHALQAVDTAIQSTNLVAPKLKLLLEVNNFTGVSLPLRQVLRFELALNERNERCGDEYTISERQTLRSY